MFEHAYLKLERAKKHLADFETEFAEFAASKPHRFVIGTNPKTGDIGLSVRVLRNPPESLALIIGDAVHNTRVTLDHAIYAVVDGDGGNTKKLKFPFAKDRVSYEAFAKGVVTPSRWIIDWLIEAEAFPGGRGEILYALNELNNLDKHRIITPTLRATSHPSVIAHTRYGGQIIYRGNRVIGGYGDFIPLQEFEPGTSIELEDDANCAPDVFIPNPFSPMPWQAVEAITKMLDGVEATLDLGRKLKPA